MSLYDNNLFVGGIMKPYLEVVKERYNNEREGLNVFNNVYSVLNPNGFYSSQSIKKICSIILNSIYEMGIDITKIKILDIGCGSGSITRYIAELTGNPKNINGIDLSENRINKAKNMNESIDYWIDDIVYMNTINIKYDLILAFDVFMHLNTYEEIMSALKNVFLNLNEDGFFVWYDLIAEDHFNGEKDDTGRGFSLEQMRSFSEDAGFKHLITIPSGKYLFDISSKHTAYQGEKIPHSLLSLMEKSVDGCIGNAALVFTK